MQFCLLQNILPFSLGVDSEHDTLDSEHDTRAVENDIGANHRGEELYAEPLFKQSLDESLTTCHSHHPRLYHIFLCLSMRFTPPRQYWMRSRSIMLHQSEPYDIRNHECLLQASPQYLQSQVKMINRFIGGIFARHVSS